MSSEGPIKQTDLDEALFIVCTPQDGVIDLVQLKKILIQGANLNSLHPWPAFTQRYAEEQSKFPLLQRIATAQNANEAADMLLMYDADLSIADPHTGNTVLHTAIAVGNNTYSLFLIEKIKNSEKQNIKKLIDQKDTKHPNWLNTPLVLAFKKGLENVVKALISAGADISIPDRNGTSPLHWAALLRYDEIIEKLLHQGADPHTLNKYNHTALELYEYEFKPLDFVQTLEYDKFNLSGSVESGTNLPELSDHCFHGGIHRKEQPPTSNICHLLATKSHGIPLDEQYMQNFIIQDTIARSAICIFGCQYTDKILPVLRLEGNRLYGPRNNLPIYAGQGIHAKRSEPPNFENTRMQIIDAIALETRGASTQIIEPILITWKDIKIKEARVEYTFGKFNISFEKIAGYSNWRLKVENDELQERKGYSIIFEDLESINQIYKHLKEGKIFELINFIEPKGATAHEIAKYIRGNSDTSILEDTYKKRKRPFKVDRSQNW